MDWIALLLGCILGFLLGGLIVFVWLSRKMQDQQKEIGSLKEERVRLQLTQEQINQQTIQFEHIANRILENNSQKLAEDNQQHMQHLLQPLKERITDFEQQILNTYQAESRERFSLQREIKQLFELNQQMSLEARNLTQALKGDNKIQGNWGELVLTSILESSGLREGEEFTLQGKDMKLRSADGARPQPDVIVRLPDQKHIIIDSKVSLTAYERYVRQEQEGGSDPGSLKQHVQSIITHINQLSQKHYADLPQLHSPDFVLLFMPIEPAFSMALQHRPDLFSYAWEKKIVLVSPTTLLASLKTVASLWKLEHQNAHAEEIARQGGALYDKFVLFVDELEKIGRNLDRAKDAYSESMNRLRLGKGNLISRAERLQELGAKTHKKLKV